MFGQIQDRRVLEINGLGKLHSVPFTRSKSPSACGDAGRSAISPPLRNSDYSRSNAACSVLASSGVSIARIHELGELKSGSPVSLYSRIADAPVNHSAFNPAAATTR